MSSVKSATLPVCLLQVFYVKSANKSSHATVQKQIIIIFITMLFEGILFNQVFKTLAITKYEIKYQKSVFVLFCICILYKTPNFTTMSGLQYKQYKERGILSPHTFHIACR